MSVSPSIQSPVDSRSSPFPQSSEKTTDLEHEIARKRKSKSPSIQTKKIKSEAEQSNLNGTYINEEEESPEQVAKQYKKFVNSPKFNLNSEEVFCICRKPDHGGELMISCDGCDEWYHFKCMKLNKDHENLIAKFYCKFCRWKGIDTTKWKRKCRLSWCWEPIRADSNSKYCSEEHGILFMKQNLIDRNHSIQDLEVNEINDTLKFVQNDYDKLVKLGSKFPELSEVLDFQSDNSNVSKFPTHVKENLTRINLRLKRINSSIEEFKLKCDYLNRYKDKIKIINEKASASLYPESDEQETKSITKKSKNKSKIKKIDVCCYDKFLNQEMANCSKMKRLIDSINIYEDFKDEIDGIIECFNTNQEVDNGNAWFNNSICIQDRKKCIRHNSWWNLIDDELTKKQDELTKVSKDLEDEKLMLLRDYSINIYESS